MNGENLVYVSYIFRKILQYPLEKTITSIALATLGFLFRGIPQEALIAVLLLIVTDFLLGIAAAHKTGEVIRSAKALRSAIKVVIYFTLIACAQVTELAIKVVPLIDETVIAFLAATEFISILENTAKLGYAIPKKLLNKLKEYTETQ